MKNRVKQELRQLPNELQFMLALLSGFIKDKELSKDGIDWDTFYELVKHHRVFPQLYRYGNERNLFPAKIFKKLQRDYIKNTFSMLKLTAEMVKVSELFIQHKIECLFLKGPVIAVDLYGEISLRTSCDLDLLIELNELENVHRLLLEEGYVREELAEPILNDWKWRQHHHTYHHPVTNIKLEIHWRLSPGPSTEPSFQELWSRKRVSSISSAPIYYMGREDLFLFLVSHGARHGWSRLRWLMDIDLMLRQSLDITLLLELLKKYHRLHIAGQAIILAEQLLGTPLNDNMKEIITRKKCWKYAQLALFYLKQPTNLHTPPIPEHISRYHGAYRILIKPWPDKMLYYLSLLLPMSADVKVLRLPRRMQFLYYPLRPFLWTWRKLNSSKNKVTMEEI